MYICDSYTVYVFRSHNGAYRLDVREMYVYIYMCVYVLYKYIFIGKKPVILPVVFGHSVQSTVWGEFKGKIVPLLNLELCCGNVVGERSIAPLSLHLCTRGVLGFTPSLSYPWVKSGKESGYAVELVLGAVQKRTIYDCDAVSISMKVPLSGGACYRCHRLEVLVIGATVCRCLL